MSPQAAASMDSAKESRRLLGGVLVTLQEVALADSDAGRRDAVLQIAESAAAVMGDLFNLERSRPDDPRCPELLDRALQGMRRVLSTLQQAACTHPQLALVAEPVAQAVATLFAATAALRAVEPEPAVEFASESAPEPSIPLTRPSRRSAQRVKIEVEVSFASESTFFAGLSLDISTGGLFVATYDLHPVGTPVAITLDLPNGHAIVANGVVCWVRESASGDVTPGMGISFARLSPPDLAAIEAFCRARTPMYYDE